MALFAPAVAGAVRSKRSKHTILPLAKLLSISIQTDIEKGHEQLLAEAIRGREGVVLVCWPHQGLPAIARALGEELLPVPDIWPEDRFDIVWTLDFDGATATFGQIPQLLLPGDSEELI